MKEPMKIEDYSKEQLLIFLRNNDLIMKDSAKYVDKVLCGYTNTCLNYSVSLVNADGAHVTYSQMGKNACFVGIIRVSMEHISE